VNFWVIATNPDFSKPLYEPDRLWYLWAFFGDLVSIRLMLS
jgi:hypothetical protein